MSLLRDLPPPSAAWHALLAPLPDHAAPKREPVAPTTVVVRDGAAIAGWEQLVLMLSAGAAGLRALLVVLDHTGRPIAASDHVLYRAEDQSHRPAIIQYQHASIGGRFEDDGSFTGTCWRSASVENEAGEQLETAAEPAQPTAAEIASLRTLVADLQRRAPPRADG